MSNRRDFLARFAGSLGSTSLIGKQDAITFGRARDLDQWLSKIKGEQRMVFDAPAVHQGLLAVWTWTFLDSHNQEGTPDENLTAVIVLRHQAIGLALTDALWKKYHLGKHFNISDPVSNTPSTRNPYWDPQPGEMPEEGMAIKKLQARGVLYGVCERAIINNSKMIARARNLEVAEVKKDLIEGLLPDMQVVPSGVWALQKLQQQGCAYCYAG